jgi:cell division protein FtsN
LAPLFAGGSGDRPRRSRWTDRIVGIVVGVVLGLGLLVYFVFVHSEGTIDAPSIDESGKPAATAPAHPGSPEEPAEEEPSGGGQSSKPGEGRQGTTKTTKAIPVVEVIGGAPPTGSGPKQLHFKQGERASFLLETSEPFSFEIKGLGITESIENTSKISFNATKVGQFPMIATATLIGVADIQVSKK